MNKPTLVIGASENPERYSNKAVNMLRKYNHSTYAYGLKTGNIADVAIQNEYFYPEALDTISIYLNPTNQKAHFDYILALKPKRVIFNPGTENPALYTLLEENGITYEEACTLVLLQTGQY
jgi:predicted CoA-binding protein